MNDVMHHKNVRLNPARHSTADLYLKNKAISELYKKKGRGICIKERTYILVNQAETLIYLLIWDDCVRVCVYVFITVYFYMRTRHSKFCCT